MKKKNNNPVKENVIKLFLRKFIPANVFGFFNNIFLFLKNLKQRNVKTVAFITIINANSNIVNKSSFPEIPVPKTFG